MPADGRTDGTPTAAARSGPEVQLRARASHCVGSSLSEVYSLHAVVAFRKFGNENNKYDSGAT